MADDPEVSSGLFRWFTKDELDEIRTQYKAAVKGHARALSRNGRLIIQGSGDGQSYTMPEGIQSLEDLRMSLEAAYADLDGELPPNTDRAVSRFR